MSEFTVRDARNTDLAAIAEIYNYEVRTTTATFDTEIRDEDAVADWFRLHEGPMYPLVVAEEKGVIVGWASLSPWSPRGAYSRTVEGSLFVAQSRRRRGIGAALTASMIERARAAGHRVVLARVETGNQPSRRLLIRGGFTPVGVMHAVGEKFGRILDIELFELVL